MHLHSGLNQAVHIPVLAVTFFLLFPTAPDTCSCSTGTLAGQTLTKLSECCGTCFTNNYHTICTVSELFSISVSVSLPLSLSLCASLSFLCFLFFLFLLNSSKPWVNEEEVRRAAWIVCLSDFLRFDLVKAWSCDVFSSWKSHSMNERLCTSEQQNPLL